MDDEYDIDCTGTEDDVIERETGKALGAGAMSAAAVRGTVGPLVRIILALLAAIGGGSVREALARANALLAPVDVEKEVERVNGQIVNCDSTFEVLALARPLVADRARLAREVERLRGERRRTEQALRSDIAAFREDRNAARAEIARLTAAPGEAWERLAKALDVKAEDRAQHAVRCREEPGEWEYGAARDAYEDAAEMVRDALAAVEPQVDVTAITHDFRPGAQDGMPRLTDVEASEIASHPVHPDLARRLAGSIATRPVALQGSVTAAELADAIERTAGEGPLAWPGSILRRLARAEQARRAAPVDRESLGRLVRDVWIAWAKEQPSPKASWLVPWEGLAEPDREVDRRIGETIARVAIGAAPTPLRALTETPRAAVAGAFEALVTWLRAGEYIGDEDDPIWVHIREVRHAIGARALTEDEAQRIAEAAVSAADTPDDPVATIRKALLRLSRGDVPPEVRPTCPGCFTGGEDAHPRSERCSGARPEAPEMAVTTGEDTPVKPPPQTWICGNCGALHEEGTFDCGGCGEGGSVGPRAPDACGHGTLSSWPCDDCERETEPPTAVPSIAGPAGLDAARKAGGGQ